MWFIHAVMLNNYCGMLDFSMQVPDFDIQVKLLNYITLHFIHVYFADSTYGPRHLNVKKGTNVFKTTHTDYLKWHINTHMLRKSNNTITNNKIEIEYFRKDFTVSFIIISEIRIITVST
jgi:hypothetical protein